MICGAVETVWVSPFAENGPKLVFCLCIITWLHRRQSLDRLKLIDKPSCVEWSGFVDDLRVYVCVC